MEKRGNLDERRRFWEQRLRDWKLSGLSQALYCRQNKLSVKSFGYWQRKIKGAPLCLVEVPAPLLTPVRSPSLAMRLVVGDRYRIEIEKDFDTALLDQLLRFLDQR